MGRAQQFLNPLFGVDDYYPIVRSLAPLAYWPLWDVSGAATAVELINGWNVTPNGVTFGATGIGDGKTAVSIPGTNGTYIDIYSTNLRDGWNPAEVSLSLFVAAANGGVWSDGSGRAFFSLRADTNNYFQINKNAANHLSWEHKAGGTRIQITTAVTGNENVIPDDTAWYHVGLTASVINSRVRAYMFGSQLGAEGGAPGTWAGSIASSSSVIGALTTALNAWNGKIAHVALWNRELTPDEMWALAWKAPLRKGHLVGFGDSITAGSNASDEAHRWLARVKTQGGYGYRRNSGLPATVLQNTVQNTVATIGAAVDNNGRDTYDTRVLPYNVGNHGYVLILYGLNDLRLNDAAFSVANFQNDLGEVIDGIVADGTPANRVVVGSPPYTEDYSGPPFDGGSAEKHQAYIAACAAVAASKGTKYVDVYQAMADNGGMALIDGGAGVHPNDAGHQAIADAFLSVL